LVEGIGGLAHEAFGEEGLLDDFKLMSAFEPTVSLIFELCFVFPIRFFGLAFRGGVDCHCRWQGARRFERPGAFGVHRAEWISTSTKRASARGRGSVELIPGIPGR